MELFIHPVFEEKAPFQLDGDVIASLEGVDAALNRLLDYCGFNPAEITRSAIAGIQAGNQAEVSITIENQAKEILEAVACAIAGAVAELRDLLEQNFIKDLDGRWHIPDLSRAKVREAMRSQVLLKEFNDYATSISQPRSKKLKEVRVEALRAGFKNCWEQKDFKTILTLGDMIPQNIPLEDEQLLMYYDIAKDRV